MQNTNRNQGAQVLTPEALKSVTGGTKKGKFSPNGGKVSSNKGLTRGGGDKNGAIDGKHGR